MRVRGRKKLFIIIILISLSSLIYLFFSYLNKYKFIVKEIEIDGNDFRIKESAKEHFQGRNIFSLDLRKMKDYLEKEFPRIEIENITKILPSQIYISYKPRRVLFQIAKGNRYYFVDKDLKIIGEIKYGPHPSYSLVSGLRGEIEKKKLLNQFFLILDDIKFPFKIDKIDIFSLESFSFYIEGKTRIILGFKDLPQKMKKLMVILEQIDKDKLRYIDLRFRDPVIKFR